MKVIFSRKGFDSGYGGMPSPVLPDGTMLSMPIPSKGDLVRYNDLKYGNQTYADIIKQLKPNNPVIKEECHLDPDIRKEVIDRMDSWRPAFGQIDAARTHLCNQGVGIGDLFLFFGWFRDTEYKDGKLTFKGPSSGFNAIYGYMQVGEIIERYEDVPSWLESHPRAKKERWVRNNAIYIAADKLSLNPELPGAGCVTFTEKHKLTKEGCSRSVWDLPEFFREIPITYNANAWKDDGFHSAAKGQEFVLTANRNILQWLQLIIT
jgi:hypothetical protein